MSPRIPWSLLLACLTMPVTTYAEVELSLYYNERPPYFETETTQIKGVRAQQLKEIMREAKIEARWISLPVNRIMQQLTMKEGAHCTGGWFKTPEREQFALFSEFFAYNEPATAILRKNFFREEYAMLSQLLIIPNIRVMTKQGQYYGDYIEEAMKLYRTHRIEVTDNHQEMMQQIDLGRADLMLVNRAEAEDLFLKNKRYESTLTTIDVQDKTPIPPLYIMCNKAIDPQLMQKINTGILRFRKTHHIEAMH
mgnify:CR=1 FL=1